MKSVASHAIAPKKWEAKIDRWCEILMSRANNIKDLWQQDESKNTETYRGESLKRYDDNKQQSVTSIFFFFF